MWDQGSKGWEGITALGSGITDHGIGISSFLGIRDQAVPHLWDQGRKLVTLLELMVLVLMKHRGKPMKGSLEHGKEIAFLFGKVVYQISRKILTAQCLRKNYSDDQFMNKKYFSCWCKIQ